MSIRIRWKEEHEIKQLALDDAPVIGVGLLGPTGSPENLGSLRAAPVYRHFRPGDESVVTLEEEDAGMVRMKVEGFVDSFTVARNKFELIGEG